MDAFIKDLSVLYLVCSGFGSYNNNNYLNVWEWYSALVCYTYTKMTHFVCVSLKENIGFRYCSHVLHFGVIILFFIRTILVLVELLFGKTKGTNR